MCDCNCRCKGFRRFSTKEERIRDLKNYKKELELEIKAVDEEMERATRP
ncbi:MAG: hypothetical protein ACXQTP_07260 [Candidatus Methanofastidiosia archaeon]